MEVSDLKTDGVIGLFLFLSVDYPVRVASFIQDDSVSIEGLFCFEET